MLFCFFATNFDTVESFHNLDMFIVFNFYNTLFLSLSNILSHFSSGIIISSRGSCFTVLSSFDFISKNLHALWTTFLEVVFTASSPVYNSCFLHFLGNNKNPYYLTHFLVFGSIEYQFISIFL